MSNKISNKQETRVIKNLIDILPDLKRTMGSGNLWFQKSDQICSMFRFEDKTKAKPSKQFTIKKEWIDKLRDEALLTDQIPVLVISFGDGEDFFLLDLDNFRNLIVYMIEGADNEK